MTTAVGESLVGQGLSEVRAVGVDGCRAGWIAAVLTAGGDVAFRVFPSIVAIAGWRAAEAARATVAVDVPMGLTETGGLRPCDLAARKLLGPLASSVFAPPGRYLLGAITYTEVRQLVAHQKSLEPTTPGLSAQAAGIIPKIAEVDAYLLGHPEAQDWLVEVHPEVSFLRWSGAGPGSKRSPSGAIRRLRLARERFPGLEDALASAAVPLTGAAFDDALDACAALWSALRWGSEAEVLGGERDHRGLVMRMVV